MISDTGTTSQEPDDTSIHEKKKNASRNLQANVRDIKLATETTYKYTPF